MLLIEKGFWQSSSSIVGKICGSAPWWFCWNSAVTGGEAVPKSTMTINSTSLAHFRLYLAAIIHSTLSGSWYRPVLNSIERVGLAEMVATRQKRILLLLQPSGAIIYPIRTSIDHIQLRTSKHIKIDQNWTSIYWRCRTCLDIVKTTEIQTVGPDLMICTSEISKFVVLRKKSPKIFGAPQKIR
jgi:hypothetical protein